MIDKQTNRPIYIQIMNMIQDMIRNQEYRPGNPILSEHEMAQKLNVSRLTVRKAYSELVQNGILRAVQGKGTFVSNDLDINNLNTNSVIRNSNKKVIGIAFPEITNFFPEILKGIEERATENGYSLNIMFNDSYEKEKKVINTMINNSVEGVILCPFRCEKFYDPSPFHLLQEANIPTVFIGKPPINVTNNSVYCDDTAGAFIAVEHLINSGYQKIIHITTTKHTDKIAYDERKKGYIDAMNMYGLSNNINIIHIQEENWKNKLMEHFNETDEYPAIFCQTDSLNFLVYNVFLSNNIDLNKITLIGYDNTNYNLPFSFSTVEQPKKLMGSLSFDLLLEDISNPKFHSNYAKYICVKPNLIIK